MKLVYDGPHDAVEVPAAGVVAERGKPVEIPDDITIVVGVTEPEKGEPKPITKTVVDSLLEQSTWSKATGRAAKDGDD